MTHKSFLYKGHKTKNNNLMSKKFANYCNVCRVILIFFSILYIIFTFFLRHSSIHTLVPSINCPQESFVNINNELNHQSIHKRYNRLDVNHKIKKRKKIILLIVCWFGFIPDFLLFTFYLTSTDTKN